MLDVELSIERTRIEKRLREKLRESDPHTRAYRRSQERDLAAIKREQEARAAYEKYHRLVAE